MVAARDWGEGKGTSRSEGVEFQLFKISSGDFLYNIGPMTNETVLYI